MPTNISMDYNITIVGDKDLMRVSGGLPSATRSNAMSLLDGLAEGVQWDMKESAPKGPTRDLVDSISIGFPHPLAREIGPTVRYAPYVERGRGPGGMPPLEGPHGLIAWANFKGMAAGAGYAVAKKIAERGVAPTWFVRDIIPNVERKVQESMRTMGSMIEGYWRS